MIDISSGKEEDLLKFEFNVILGRIHLNIRFSFYTLNILITKNRKGHNVIM